MEASRSTWTDPRLDDLRDSVAVINQKVTRLDKKVDEGVARLDGKFDEGFARLDGRIDGTNERIDSLNHTMVQGMIALISIIAVLLSILVGIFAAKLFF